MLYNANEPQPKSSDTDQSGFPLILSVLFCGNLRPKVLFEKQSFHL